MCRNPSAEKKSAVTSLNIQLKMGPVPGLRGRTFRFCPGRLTRLTGDNPAGASLLLETLQHLSDLESSVLQTRYWPRMQTRFGTDIEYSGIAPCFSAVQERFFARERRTLGELFKLDSLISAYREQQTPAGRCPDCSRPLRKADAAVLADWIRAQTADTQALTVSAPLPNPGPKRRRSVIGRGFQRFWIADRLVDSEDIDQAGLWPQVQAVLIDMMQTASGDRIEEALLLARQVGEGGVWLKIGQQTRIIDMQELICPNCLRNHPGTVANAASSRQDCPDAARLRAWWEKSSAPVSGADPVFVAHIFQLLDRFGLSDLSLGLKLEDLDWAAKGLLLMLATIANGGQNRFLLIDAPFWGLDRRQVETVRRLIDETLAQGWGWIVAADQGLLADSGADDIDLARSDAVSAVTADRATAGTLARNASCAWRGRLRLSEEVELELESGSREELSDRFSLEGDWGSDACRWVPEADRRGFLPVLKVARHDQAWVLSASRRRTLAGYLGWERLIGQRMAQLPESRARGMTQARLLGRGSMDSCPACRGLGLELKEGVGRLAANCPVCRGVGVRGGAAAVRYRRLSLYDIMCRTVREMPGIVPFVPRLELSTANALRLGFGDTVLCRRIWTLSVSERWLLVLLAQLTSLANGGVWIVEQPFLGLSATQRAALDGVFSDFTRCGGALVTVGCDSATIR